MVKILYYCAKFLTTLMACIFMLTVLNAEQTQQQVLGEYEFMNNCAVCHGKDAKGMGPMANQLIKPPSDLTVLSKNNGGSFPETMVYQLIDGRKVQTTEEGRGIAEFHGPSEMPIWGDRFRAIEGDEEAVDERISNVIEFLKMLQTEAVN